jgi:hypothetical protein
MWGTETESRHKWQYGAVVEEGTRKGKVVGSNPAGCVAREFYMKNVTTYDFDRDEQTLVGRGLPRF